MTVGNMSEHLLVFLLIEHDATLFDSCKISLKRLKRHTQSKSHAVLGPFGLYVWFWSPLKGDTLGGFLNRITVSLTDKE